MVKLRIDVDRSELPVTVAIRKSADWPVMISDDFNEIELDIPAARKLATFLTANLGVEGGQV